MAKKQKKQKDNVVWKMEVTSSSNIVRAAYNLHKRRLLIEFKTGTRYVYEDVSVDEFTGFSLAESKGVWFQTNIKNDKEFTKLD